MAGTVATDLSFFTGTTGGSTSDCDATTDWSGSPTLDTETFLEGTGALSAKVSKTTYTSVFTLAASVDLSDTLIIAWMSSATPAGLDSQANGGLRIRIEDASVNWAEYYVGGNDTYTGGWEAFTVRTNQSTNRTESATPPTYTAITKIGVVFKMTGSSAKVNCWWDAVRYGTYVQVYAGTSGSPATFDDFLTAEASNYYGAFVERDGILFVQTKVYIGSTTAAQDTYFSDSSKVLVFRDRDFGTGFYELTTQGNATATTQEIYFGTKSGTSGISGCTIRSAGTATVALDFSDTNVAKLGLYGCNFYDAAATTLPNATTNREALNCNWEASGQVTANICNVTNCNFINADDGGGSVGALLITSTSHKVTYCNFIANPDGVHFSSAGTYAFDHMLFTGNTYDIGNSSAGLVTVNATDSDPTTFENTGGGTTSIKTSVNLNIHVEDSGGNNLADAQCYIAKSTLTQYTSHATGNVQGDLDFVVQEAITTDTPSAGWLRVLTAEETEQLYRFASWTTSTFTLETKIGPTACTGGGTSTSLQDTVTDFTAINVAVGDTVRNETDSSWATVLEIVDANNITTSPLQGGSDNTWTATDNYSLHNLALTYDGSDYAYTPYMNEPTDSSGDAASVTNFGGITAVTVKVRKYGHKTFRGTGSITASGYSADVILADEPNIGL